jgi:hypothetical protein
MRYETTAALVALLGAASGLPFIAEREVPQEHSHNKFISSVTKSVELNNKLGLKDAVFPILGNKAAVEGLENAGSFKDLDCLQQATADLAFTNAKAAGDVSAQGDALVYRTLERNTGSVGLKSNLCTSQKAVNPEVAALTQHQDPASEGAAAANKQVELDLAKQLSAIGDDSSKALESATFAPGKIGDPTAKGNTCDVAADAIGCGISQKLIVPQISAADIKAAGKVKARAAAVNVQTFNGNVGGAPPPVLFTAGADRPFAVNGDTFLNAGAALTRSCDVQHNACSTAANGKKISGGSAQCETQKNACDASVNASEAKVKNAKQRRAAGIDLGSCSNPGIVFGAGFDGRKEDSFEPADKAEFSHGSALKIGVVADFTCGQLQSKCKANDAAVQACKQGSAAAEKLTGQASADAFNKALGVSEKN